MASSKRVITARLAGMFAFGIAFAACSTEEVAGPPSLAVAAVPSGGGITYYVSPTGNDANTGLSSAAAFRTIQRGGDLLQAGDILQLAGGDYIQPDSSKAVFRIKRSGNAGAWITIRAASGQKPRLVCRNRLGIQIDSSSYILIQGLELQGNNLQLDSAWAMGQGGNSTNPLTNGVGILIGGLGRYSHDIEIRDNSIHDFPGAGIASVNADYLRIQGNTIHDNALYSPKAGSGISTYQNWNSNSGAGYHNRILANRIYRNRNLVASLTIGTITDGNGIIVDDSRNSKNGATIGVYNGRTLIANNLVYENGGRGIHVYRSDHVDIVNNSTYHNSLHPTGTKGEITIVVAGDVKATNNILVSITGGRANQLYEATSVVNDYNLVSDAKYYALPGTHDRLNVDPLYTAAPGNLAPKSTSPAINHGGSMLNVTTDFLGHGRPFGGTVDQGAYEYGSP